MLKLLLLPFSFCAFSLSVGASAQPKANIGNVNPTQNTSSSTACANVHITVVRASTEQPGQGVIGTLATMISGAIPGSTVEAIDYPALLNPCGLSSSNGTTTTTGQLQKYVDSCNKASVVLLGYSQGAHVVGDVMCGGGQATSLGPSTPPIAKKYQDKVVAMIQMGDPRHVAQASFDVGSSQGNGIFPRPANISCNAIAAKIRSYCDSGDSFYDIGDDVQVHLSYTQRL
ncbi:alpha/beta-hydrolase [Tothia fuscella]|uniref:Alpha/beta-hydrolase n=1 Tax=Tothia fuscella TaxID=1048955 RepID=A0A9P4P1P8_9PEZI|nr:alpha/beta-hydrolase [Tothia fuscella]